MSVAKEKLLILQSSLGELSMYNPQWCKDSQNNKKEDINTVVNLPQSPVDIVVTEQAGRQLVAARHVYAGEILFREPVLLPLVPKQSSGPTCLNCLKTLPDVNYPQCDFCGVPLCLTNCDGILHSIEECQTLSKKGINNEQNVRKKMLHVMEVNTIITPLRAILMFKKYPAKQYKVGLLEANIEKRADMNEEIIVDKKIVSVLQNLLGEEIDKDEIFRVCACYDTNSFGVQVSKSYPGRARAVFLITSMMNHDCLQNTEHWYDNGFMNVRAAVDIPEGEAITLNYSEVMWGTRARQGHLFTSKFFNCCCQRCSSPSELGTHLSSVLCRRCGNLVEPPHRNNTQDGDGEEILICSMCSWTIEAKQLMKIIKTLGLTAAMVSPSNFKAIHKLCGDVVSILGPQHYTAVLLRYRILQALDNTDLQELEAEILCEILQMSEALIKVTEVIAPGMSLFRGNILLRHLRLACELIARINKEENLETSILTKDLLSRSDECKEIFKFQDEYLTTILEIQHCLKSETNSNEDGKSTVSCPGLLPEGVKGTDRQLWYHLFL